MRKRRNIRTANRGFLVGIACMAIMVILIVLLFWYWCLPPDQTPIIPTE